MIKNEKYYNEPELRQLPQQRKYEEKEHWTISQWIVLMQNEPCPPNHPKLAEMSGRKTNSVRFAVDRIMNNISTGLEISEMGLSNHDKLFSKAIDIVEKSHTMHPKYFQLVMERRKKKIEKLKVKQSTITTFEKNELKKS